MNKLPNFLIIGAAKSGTTALYHYLGQHPEVFLSPIKETNFFAQKGNKVHYNGPMDNSITHKKTITDIVNYKNQFINVFDEKAIGEICPSYLYFEDAAKNIKEHINLLVIGGSQGAKIFDNLIKASIIPGIRHRYIKYLFCIIRLFIFSISNRGIIVSFQGNILSIIVAKITFNKIFHL